MVCLRAIIKCLLVRIFRLHEARPLVALAHHRIQADLRVLSAKLGLPHTVTIPRSRVACLLVAPGVLDAYTSRSATHSSMFNDAIGTIVRVFSTSCLRVAVGGSPTSYISRLFCIDHPSAIVLAPLPIVMSASCRLEHHFRVVRISATIRMAWREPHRTRNDVRSIGRHQTVKYLP